MAGDTPHEALYQEALTAVTKLFGYNECSPSVTRATLSDLVGEIEIMIDSLEIEEST